MIILDKDTQNLSSHFDPFDATKQRFIKDKRSEEDDTSNDVSIPVSISVLKAVEEPTVFVDVKVQPPVTRKKQNNNEELVHTGGKNISNFTVQVRKKT